jgi:hypothetical protein
MLNKDLTDYPHTGVAEPWKGLTDKRVSSGES